MSKNSKMLLLLALIALPLIWYILLSDEEPSPTIEAPASQVEEIEEVVLTSEEVNPTEESEDVIEPAFQTYTPEITEYRGKIQYTQDEVRLYPVMERICSCESGRQFWDDGRVVRGHVNPLDIGMCQINLKYHGEASKNMGLDVFDEADNITYANWLYDQQGPQPWFWSEPCHGVS